MKVTEVYKKLIHVVQTDIMYTQRHKLRTAYSTNDCRGKWVAISKIFISIYLALVTQQHLQTQLFCRIPVFYNSLGPE